MVTWWLVLALEAVRVTSASTEWPALARTDMDLSVFLLTGKYRRQTEQNEF